jgi:photosystem II stability/assembly factor-like uncharacterized protein
LKGGEMKNHPICILKPAKSYGILPVFLYILILPAVCFCASWEAIGPEGGNFIFSLTNPADANEVTAITTSPSPSNVYRSTDAGASWNKIGEIPSTYIYDVSAFDFSTIYAITSSRCYRSTDGGVSWTAASMPSSMGWAFRVVSRVCADPTDSSKIYAAGYIIDYQNYPYTSSMVFFKSTDGGLSWSASPFFAFYALYPSDMAISASNPNVIYIAGMKEVQLDYYYAYYGALFKSTDAGESWTDISDSVESESGSSFYSIAIDPTDEDKVYVAGTYFYSSSRTGRGHELSWERSPERLSTFSIKIDPVEPSRIYVIGYPGVSVSTNYGQSWITHNSGMRSSARHVEVAPADPSKVYVSSLTGFYKSTDSGTTWSPAHEGIYTASISVLAAAPSAVIVQNSGYLMAYKRGRTATWQDVVTPESYGEVCDILINPDNPDTVLILEDYGLSGAELFRSTDGCSVWDQVDQYFSDGGCLALDPSNPNIAYAGGSYYNSATGKYSMSVCKTTNGGISWPIRRFVGNEGDYSICKAIAVAPGDSTIVYTGGLQNYYAAVLYSSDAGNSWVDITEGLDSLLTRYDSVYAIWVSPLDPRMILVGTLEGVFKRVAFGRGQNSTWSPTAMQHSTNGFAYDPLTGIIYAATVNGVFETDDAGLTWRALNDGLDCLETLCIALDSDNGLLYVGTNGGSVWRLSVGTSGMEGEGIVDPN